MCHTAQITLAGLGRLEEDGHLWTLEPDGAELVITPKVLSTRSAFSAAAFQAVAATSRAASIKGPKPQAPDYKLLITCVSPCPTNTHRLTLGVGEEVNVSLDPLLTQYASQFITWSATGGSVSVVHSNATKFTAPSNAVPASVTMEYRGVSYTTNFTVFQPSGIKATLHGQPDAFAIGTVGAGMRMDVVLQPTNVSFYRVQIIEPAANATNKQGCFTNTVPPNHDQDHGAGAWHAAASSNLVVDGVFDHASSYGWSIGQAGSYTWPISPFWRVVGSTDSHALSGWTDQVHSLASDGTMTVEKLGHQVRRRTSEARGTAQ